MFLKKSSILKILILLALSTNTKCCETENPRVRPNIVIIFADDLGSYDISIMGSNQIPTPNIDALACQGVIFNRYYTAPMCSPSRSSLLTGKYIINTGMQHLVIFADEPRSLPLNEILLSDYLHEVGYRTHIVGKWHLGMARKNFTPLFRGFDSHIGNLGPFIDYFDFTHQFSYYSAGFDFRYNMDIYHNRTGEYATDVIADEARVIIENHDSNSGPLFLYVAQVSPHSGNANNKYQALPADIARFSYIQDTNRRTYAAMVWALDRSVGTIVKALKTKGLIENTIILFCSDNGGPTTGQYSTTASNYPRRGQKDGPWEGAINEPAIVWSSLFEQRHYVSNHLVHVTDWFATFAELGASTTYKSKVIDGFDIWSTLSCNEASDRTEIVHNIDTIDNYISYLNNGYKYVAGTTNNGQYDGWLGGMTYENGPGVYTDIVMQSDVWLALNPYATKVLTPNDITAIRDDAKTVCAGKNSQSTTCSPTQAACLFDIFNDPCEENNIASTNKVIMDTIEARLQVLMQTMVPPNNLPTDRNANPSRHGGIWTWWLEDTTKSFQLSDFLTWMKKK